MLLALAGANVRQRDSRGQSPVDLAHAYGMHALAKALTGALGNFKLCRGVDGVFAELVCPNGDSLQVSGDHAVSVDRGLLHGKCVVAPVSGCREQAWLPLSAALSVWDFWSDVLVLWTLIDAEMWLWVTLTGTSLAVTILAGCYVFLRYHRWRTALLHVLGVAIVEDTVRALRVRSEWLSGWLAARHNAAVHAV